DKMLPMCLDRTFEELLVNALIHRDYFVSAPIRLFVFSDRIEIISPGHLPNNLTIAKIRTGNSNIRNPILASFIAKGLLPYRGLGSGIKRALEEWPEIDFVEDRDGCLFTVNVHRKPVGNSVEMPFYSEKRDAQGIGVDVKGALKGRFDESNSSLNVPLSELQNLMLVEITENSKISYLELVEKLNKDRRTIGRNIQQLKEMGVLRRVGSKKTGFWEIIE
ncbi:MAG: hypothetical protein K940chlam7_01971, partial [Chlamydiae bacterium]|nr:hypothetical protein [Chlamydiota bacterium]